MAQRLMLASASPQRKSLLEGLGVTFEILPPKRPESDCEETDPVLRSQELAKMKAQEIAQKHEDAFVIGCDTLVVAHDGTLFEKPHDADDARRMLVLQSGSVSTVHSAVCIVSPRSGDSRVSGAEGINSSEVHFKELLDKDLDWWISTNLWQNRSGSFQIDGPGQLLIERIEGDFTGVVGLPVFLLGQLLEEAGYDYQFNC